MTEESGVKESKWNISLSGGSPALAEWRRLAKEAERMDAERWAYAANQPDLQIALVVLLAELAMEHDLVDTEVKRRIRQLLYQPRTYCSLPWIPTVGDEDGCRLRKLPDVLLDVLRHELLDARVKGDQVNSP